jgi:hypothetical protein
MMVQDVRKQTIPLCGLIVFASVSLYHTVTVPHAEGFWAAGVLGLLFMACHGAYYLLKHEHIIGWGDIILSPFCGLWLHSREIPLYLISTGVFALLIGLFWRRRWRLKTFSMIPALLSGLGFVLLIRCFLTVNGI